MDNDKLAEVRRLIAEYDAADKALRDGTGGEYASDACHEAQMSAAEVAIAYCRALPTESLPAVESSIPHNAVCFFMDGNAWCCVFGDFVNLQESPAGFGDSFDTALADLKKENV